MPRTGRGRWYEAVGGLGLEVETDCEDPEYAWRIACIIETEGKRSPVFRIKINQMEESYFAAGNYRTLEDAKAEVLRMFKVTELAEEEKPAPFSWMQGARMRDAAGKQ